MNPLLSRRRFLLWLVSLVSSRQCSCGYYTCSYCGACHNPSCSACATCTEN